MPKQTLAEPASSALDVLKNLSLSLPVAAEDEDLTETLVGRILAAPDRATRLTPLKAPGFGDKEGAVFTVHGLRRVEGGLNKDLGFFLLVDATDHKTGERSWYSTGAARVVAALLADWRDGLFPCDYRIAHVASRKNVGNVVQFLIDPNNF